MLEKFRNFTKLRLSSDLLHNTVSATPQHGDTAATDGRAVCAAHTTGSSSTQLKIYNSNSNRHRDTCSVLDYFVSAER